MPPEYAKAADRLYGTPPARELEAFELWRAGVPAEYAHALRSMSVPIIKFYWDQSMSIDYLQSYGVWAGEYPVVSRLRSAGVPVSYSLPLLQAGYRVEPIVEAFRSGIPLEFALAAV